MDKIAINLPKKGDIQMVEVGTQENLYSEYPQEMEKYFAERKLVIKTIPVELVQIEGEPCELKISTIKEFYDYLNSEIAFWNEQDKGNKLNSISQKGRLSSAKSYLDNALGNYKTNNTKQGENYIGQCISTLSYGSLYSKTSITEFILQYTTSSTEFINGIQKGLSRNRISTGLGSSVAEHEGFLAAIAFIKQEKNIWETLGNHTESFKQSVEQAIQNYATLDANYVKAFHEQQERIQLITDQTNKHLQDLDADSEKYFAEREARCVELEKIYDEKLMLSKPAEYWQKLQKDYRLNGIGWFIASVATAVVIIAGLVVLLLIMPSVFAKDSHWIEIFRNSAIITVITSISVYILRILVKMTMSSFHLARDAQERYNLTQYYLSLIEHKAISDKDRVIVLNALFSRSDTGLLKNDSGPTMSSNVSELVDTVNRQ